jgi:hypothetical protein
MGNEVGTDGEAVLQGIRVLAHFCLQPMFDASFLCSIGALGSGQPSSCGRGRVKVSLEFSD